MQIGPENAHVVKVVMDEVFGRTNRIADIHFIKAAGRGSGLIDTLFDHLFYAKDKQSDRLNFLCGLLQEGRCRRRSSLQVPRASGQTRDPADSGSNAGGKPHSGGAQVSSRSVSLRGETDTGSAPFIFKGETFRPPPGNHWKLTPDGLKSLIAKRRIFQLGKKQLRYKRYPEDSEWGRIGNMWQDTQKGTFQGERRYVVKTADKVVARCVCMVTRPGIWSST